MQLLWFSQRSALMRPSVCRFCRWVHSSRWHGFLIWVLRVLKPRIVTWGVGRRRRPRGLMVGGFPRYSRVEFPRKPPLGGTPGGREPRLGVSGCNSRLSVRGRPSLHPADRHWRRPVPPAGRRVICSPVRDPLMGRQVYCLRRITRPSFPVGRKISVNGRVHLFTGPVLAVILTRSVKWFMIHWWQHGFCWPCVDGIRVMSTGYSFFWGNGHFRRVNTSRAGVLLVNLDFSRRFSIPWPASAVCFNSIIGAFSSEQATF